MSHDVFDWTVEWTRARGIKCWSANEADSTNSVAKNDETFAPQPPSIGKISEPTLYLVREQTAGRGRGTNVWVGAENSLLSSWSFRIAASAQPIASPLVGLALHDALRRSFAGLDLSLKAPNDVYSDGKKIAGLLIESVVTGADVKIVVGLGLNVMSVPPGVAVAGALSERQRVAREQWLAFLDAWKNELTRALTAGQDTVLQADVRLRLCEALNAYPHLPEPILNVGEHGQIQTARGYVHWHEL